MRTPQARPRQEPGLRRARVVSALPRSPAKGRVVLEIVYTGILVLAFLFIGWFAVYVVYKLYEGQR